MLDAKTHLSRIVSDLESHPDDQVVIARNGRPVAVLRSIAGDVIHRSEQRIGVARGAFILGDDIDSPYGDLADLFEGSE